GVLMASYSVMQFLFSPVWGRLSDRIGRRPVLLVSTAGAAVSYSVFALGSGLNGQFALAVLLLSRMFAGICGANITVAQAYIADVTPAEERSKRMGLIGMAFGLGFIFGPALSSLSLSGITGAVIQGGAIGRAVKKLGEPLLISLSLLLVAISMAMMPFVHGSAPFSWRLILHHEGVPWLELLFVLALLSIGSSLTRPPVFGLISMLTPAHEQGATIGVAQGAGSLARIVGPMFAATLFDKHPALPYLICAALS